MTSKTSVFVDSDVVISSLISEKGAAFLLLQQKKGALCISDQSIKELKRVTKRLGLHKKALEELVKKKLQTVELKKESAEIKQEYGQYVTDQDDAHVLAGATTANCRFILTYNHRHFRIGKIKNDLDIIIYTPAQYLQYLRSSK